MNSKFGMIPGNQPVNNPFNLVDHQQQQFDQSFWAPVYGNAVNASSTVNYDYEQQLQESENFFDFHSGMNAEFGWSSPVAPAGYDNFDPQFSAKNSEFVWSSLPDPMASAGYGNSHPRDETFSCYEGSSLTNLEFDRSCLPPGYRFCPTSKELIVDYLYKKVRKEPLPTNEIPEINLYNYDPEDFKAEFPQNSEDKWYFFTRKIYTSDAEKRAKRVTPKGFWKASSKSKPVAGTRGTDNTLVYHSGSGKGKKTNWIMHEYTLKNPNNGERNTNQNWAMCCIYYRKEKEDKPKQEEDQNWANV